MSSTIPSQLPPFVAAVRSGALQALALQAGQVLDGKIIGPAPNGGTQVEIRGQMLNLVLPTLLKAGETIKLEVQGTGPQLRLALQVATPTTAPASPAPAAPAPQANLPLPNPNVAAQVPLQSAESAVAAQSSAPQATVATSAPPQRNAPTPTAPPAQAQLPTNSAVPTQTAGQAAAPTSASVTPQQAALPLLTTPAPNAQPVVATATASPVQVTTPTTVATTPLAVSVYPQVAPTSALPNPHAVAIPAAASAPVPAAASPVSGAVRPVIATTAIANATAHSASGNPLPQQPQQAATPQAALAQMVHASVPSQGSVTALTTALSNIAGKVVLPEPVVRAAQQVLAGRIAIASPRFDGAALQAAVRGSGVFQEAGLVSGQPLLQPDMKSALLTLRQTLTTWLGNQAPVAAPTQIAPPLRGSIPRAKAGDPPPLDPSDPPEEIGKQLLERTESALSRVRLHQHASLPDPVGKTADWSMDLPVMVGTHQTLMQLQIHRDQHSDSEAAAERGWQMRFALSLPAMGEVGAQVTMRAGTVGVMLWATDPTASASLDAEIQDLRDSLAGTGLHPGAVIVRHGEPPALPSSPPSGHFLDARS